MLRSNLIREIRDRVSASRNALAAQFLPDRHKRFAEMVLARAVVVIAPAAGVAARRFVVLQQIGVTGCQQAFLQIGIFEFFGNYRKIQYRAAALARQFFSQDSR